MKKIMRIRKGRIEYRDEGKNTDRTILILHGGHSTCDTQVPHMDVLLKLGYRVIVPSRPGYGRTSQKAGKTTEKAVESILILLDNLSIEKTVVMACSAGGRTALQLAGRYPERVEKLVLYCAVTKNPWPESMARVFAYAMMNPLVVYLFWPLFRTSARVFPMATLTSIMSGLTTLDPKTVVGNMTKEQQTAALAYLCECRASRGFLSDIKHHGGDPRRITAPTLVIHSRFDGSNVFSHAEYSVQHIAKAELFEVPAESHLMWISPEKGSIESKLKDFLMS